MKKLGKALLALLLTVFLIAALAVGFLTVTEYRPGDLEPVAISAGTTARPALGQELTVLSWNVGYGALGAAEDFFMDGGQGVRSADRAAVERYLAGIRSDLAELAPDIVMLQEVDVNSARSHGIDEREALSVAGTDRTFALNYSTHFVPYPLPPIGRVHAGLFTMSGYLVDRAERVSLPCPFSWPVRAVNLKRCLLVDRLPVEGSGAELVLVNLHLEAYDSGEGKIAQTRQLSAFIQSEYEKGNYVIAGGDFNQVFPDSLALYPNEHAELWSPGVLEEGALPEGFVYAWDPATPTCRLLNQPYDPADAENTQYYVIDGYILSPNVTLRDVETLDMGFENSDHNPVRLTVTLD